MADSRLMTVFEGASICHYNTILPPNGLFTCLPVLAINHTPPNPELPEAYGIQFDSLGIYTPNNAQTGLDGDLEIINFDTS